MWHGLDVEVRPDASASQPFSADAMLLQFLTSFIISIMKSIDIRSESAVMLLAEFLDMDEPYTPGGIHRNAEHFAHGKIVQVESLKARSSEAQLNVKL